MKLKGIELNGFYEIECTDNYFNIYDEKGNRVYFEDSVGYWAKWEYDEYGNQLYYENSDRNKYKKNLFKEHSLDFMSEENRRKHFQLMAQEILKMNTEEFQKFIIRNGGKQHGR